MKIDELFRGNRGRGFLSPAISRDIADEIQDSYRRR